MSEPEDPERPAPGTAAGGDAGDADAGDDDGPDDASGATASAGGEPGPDGPRKRRRRRRRRGPDDRAAEAKGGAAGEAASSGGGRAPGPDGSEAAAPSAGTAADRPGADRARGSGDPRPQGRGPNDRGGQGGGGQDRGAPGRGPTDRGAQDRGPNDRGRGPNDRGRGPNDRGSQGRGPNDRGSQGRGPDDRGSQGRGPDDRGGPHRGANDRGPRPGGDAASTSDPAIPTESRPIQDLSDRLPPMLQAPRGGVHRDPHEDDDAPAETGTAWGTDDGAPAPAVTLTADLPVDPPAGDPDPLTHALLEAAGATLGDDVASVVGVRFVPAGRIQWFDAGDAELVPGDRVVVDADRGTRLAWVATVPTRRATRDRGLRRVIRRAGEPDLRGERERDGAVVTALRIAKDRAAALKLPLKVFRVERADAGKLNVYYTSDDRIDVRDFLREVSAGTGARIELRQLGVRDEAKAVGGIGSCGLTLCCTTWMPEFVPVSIKMAKDQGLVLSPTKVAGQCGRLKCCLVYEQAGYAELRKGLPKLGKRVIGARGEGRVVEVDVLRQRVRVSYGAGDTEVVPASEVKPLFAPGGGPRPGGGPGGDRGSDRGADRGADASADPGASPDPYPDLYPDLASDPDPSADPDDDDPDPSALP